MGHYQTIYRIFFQPHEARLQIIENSRPSNDCHRLIVPLHGRRQIQSIHLVSDAQKPGGRVDLHLQHILRALERR